MTQIVDPRWSCNRKKRYPTLDIAESVAREVMRHHPDLTLNGYDCTSCGGAHIGRKAAWRKD